MIAVSAAVALMLGAGTAYAGDTVLFTPMLSAPTGGQLVCNVTNVGKKTLPKVEITIMNNLDSVTDWCLDLLSASASENGHTCSMTTASDVLCQVTITGGSYRSVRAVLNVVDSSGATILSVPATK